MINVYYIWAMPWLEVGTNTMLFLIIFFEWKMLIVLGTCRIRAMIYYKSDRFRTVWGPDSFVKLNLIML